MMKLWSFVFAAMALCIMGYAHAPERIAIQYDTNSNALEAVIVHDIDSEKGHYIKTVDVIVNGKKAAEKTFSEQGDSRIEKVYFYLPHLKRKDAVEVEAQCSLGGTLKVRMRERDYDHGHYSMPGLGDEPLHDR